MSSLKYREKRKLEELLEMSNGHLLDFSHKTMRDFFDDEIDIDINDQKYQVNGTSKASKMRTFWQLESDHIVGKLLMAIINDKRSKIDKYIEEGNNTHGLWREEITEINKTLKQIDDCEKIAKRLLSSNVNTEDLKNIAEEFNSDYIAKQIQRMEKAIENDPALAIGTAKDLIETCCKTILKECNIQANAINNIPQLTKATLKELKLLPEDIDDNSKGSDHIKKLLNNLSTISTTISELRNLYGTGHGKDSQSKGLSSRHAKLAVGATATFVRFIFDTYLERKNK